MGGRGGAGLGAGMTLQGGSLHVDTPAVLQTTAVHTGDRDKAFVCLGCLLVGHLRHSAVLQCLASVCCHTTAHWSLVCQGVTSISTILQALLLCRIFLNFCFLKCPLADLTAHWSLVCQGVTSLSTILQALLLCRIFLKFCFLKCPQADLILPLYSQLKMPGQAIYPSPPASRHCSAVHFSVSSAVRLSAGRCCCCDVEVLMLLLSRA